MRCWQRLLRTNLLNWGAELPKSQKGWLRGVTAEEYESLVERATPGRQDDSSHVPTQSSCSDRADRPRPVVEEELEATCISSHGDDVLSTSHEEECEKLTSAAPEQEASAGGGRNAEFTVSPTGKEKQVTLPINYAVSRTAPTTPNTMPIFVKVRPPRNLLTRAREILAH